MVQYPIKISEENSKNSRFYGYLKLVLILSHFCARTLYLMTSRLLHFLIILVVKKFARNESLLFLLQGG